MPIRPALALFAVLCAPAVCSAGPIEFHYAATGNPIISYPGAYYSNFPMFTISPEMNISLPATGGLVGIGTVNLTPSSVPPMSTYGPYPFETPTGPTSAFAPFVVSVTVTDPQGRSAELPIYSTTHEEWVPGPGPNVWFSVYNKLEYGGLPFGDNSNSIAAVLGNTKYTFTGRADGEGLVGVYTLTVAPVAATPEPCTLALAALGLVPLSARLFRRTRPEAAGTPA